MYTEFAEFIHRMFLRGAIPYKIIFEMPDYSNTVIYIDSCKLTEDPDKVLFKPVTMMYSWDEGENQRLHFIPHRGAYKVEGVESVAIGGKGLLNTVRSSYAIRISRVRKDNKNG